MQNYARVNAINLAKTVNVFNVSMLKIHILEIILEFLVINAHAQITLI
jgi:hypothetical protein